MWSLQALDPRVWAPDRRKTFGGAIVLFVLLNLTLLPFVLGHSSLEDSVGAASSLYSSGSRFPAVAAPSVNRVLDPGAPAWQTEPDFIVERWQLTNEKSLPLWNPYSAYGTPLAADMQSQPYSPFAWIRLAWPTPRGYDVFVMLRLYAAGLGAFLFMRLFTGVLPAIVAGCSYMYAGYFWLYVTMPELSTEVLLPAVLYAFERLLRRPDAIASVVLAVAVAASIFGGMPEAALLLLAVSYCYAAIRFATDVTVRSRLPALCLYAFAATVLGLALTAILTLPFIEYVGVSFNDHSGPEGNMQGLGADGFGSSSLVQYLAPLIAGPPYNDIFSGFSGYSGIRGYVGVAACFFAFVAVFAQLEDTIRRRRRGFPIFFFAFVAVCMLGKRWGAGAVNWIGMLPGFRLINFPKYEENLIALAVALLAAFGVAALCERRISGPVVWAATAVPLVVLAISSSTDRMAVAALSMHRDYYVNAMAGALTALCIAAYAGFAALRGASARVVGCVAIALVVAELNGAYIYPLYYVVNTRAKQAWTAQNGAPYTRFVRDHLTAGDRFFATDDILYPEWSSAFQIPDIRALDALYARRYLPFVSSFLPQAVGAALDGRFAGDGVDFGDPLQQRLMQLSSVEYVATTHPIAGTFADALRRGTLPAGPTLNGGAFTISGVTKPALFMHPPRARFPVRLTVPRGGEKMSLWIGMLDGVWAKPICGDGVFFTVEAEADGRTRSLFRRYIDPKHDVSLRAWQPVTLDLSGYAARTIRLLFSTAVGPSGHTCDDWAVWSEPSFTRSERKFEQFAPVFSEPGATVYRFGHPLPRISVYGRIVRAHDGPAALRTITGAAFDPEREVAVESDDPALRALDTGGGKPVAAGRLEAYRSLYVKASVDASAPALVMLNDTDFPGWRARVDGREAKIYTADYLFRGVLVGSGRHVLEYSYAPASFAIGLAVTIVAALLLVALAFVGVYRRRVSARAAADAGRETKAIE